MGRAMKDSGVEWIGEIPFNWATSKMKYIGHYVNGFAFKPEDWSSEGKQIIRIQDLTGTNDNPNYYNGVLDDKYLVKKGDILVSWAATLNAFIWNKENGWLNQHIFNAFPDELIVNREFFFWLIKLAMENMNNDNKHGIMMQHVTLDVFGNFLVPLPPKNQQQSIAVILNSKCAEIDSIIHKISVSIEEYNHLKQAVITRAVTKGLNRNFSLSESNVIWLDKIPAHWRISKLKYELFPQNRPVIETDDIITCFRDGIVTLRKNRREDGFTISLTENGYHGVNVGDLVIHGMDAFAGAIGCSDSRGKTTPVVHVCETTGNNRFFMYFLRGMAYNNVFMDFSNGIRIRSSDFRNFARLGIFDVCVPPIEEQNEIAAYLDEKCAEIDALIAKEEQLLTELENYKKSLIYEYVTGKKSVQE